VYQGPFPPLFSLPAVVTPGGTGPRPEEKPIVRTAAALDSRPAGLNPRPAAGYDASVAPGPHPLSPPETPPVPRSSPSNAALLEQCAAGDEIAWSRLVARYESLVYSVALGCGLSPDDAGDVFQQVWLELHRSLHRIRVPQALPRWLMVSTRRLCFKHVVRGSRNVSDVGEDMVDERALPDEDVERYETRRRLETALDSLGRPCSRLVRLLFLEDEKVPYEEVSRRTGLAVGSIGPIRSRCLHRLRRLMEDPS